MTRNRTAGPSTRATLVLVVQTRNYGPVRFGTEGQSGPRPAKNSLSKSLSNTPSVNAVLNRKKPTPPPRGQVAQEIYHSFLFPLSPYPTWKGRVSLLSSYLSLTQIMVKTTDLLTSPAPGTVVKPVFVYDDAQKEKLRALREVRLRLPPPSVSSLTLLPPLFSPPQISYSLLLFLVCLFASPPR